VPAFPTRGFFDLRGGSYDTLTGWGKNYVRDVLSPAGAHVRMVDGMKEKELKIDDIAQITGIPAEEVRRIIGAYDGLFTYRTIGRVKLFPHTAVRTVQDLAALTARGLAQDEVLEEYRSEGTPRAAPTGAEEPGVRLPPEVVVDLQVMRDALAQQQRQMTRLFDELERERERSAEAIDRLNERLEHQQRQLDVVSDWVEYFDAQVDEMNRPLLEKIRQALRRD